MSAKRVNLLTGAELTELWRPRPDFVGPSMPPMIAWQRAGEPGASWHRAQAWHRTRSAPIASSLFESGECAP